MEKIILLYTFLKISFSQYKEYLIFQISFSKFSNVLHAFTCASTGNLFSFCLWVNILRCKAKSERRFMPSICSTENITLLKALRTFSLRWKSSYKLSNESRVWLFSGLLGFVFS